MAAALDALGIRPGDRVAYVGPNAARFVVALFAVAGTGRVFVPINYRLAAKGIEFIVRDAGAGIVLVDPECQARTATTKVNHHIVMDGVADAELFAARRDDIAWADVDETRPASINYTSGTTSVPKGVVLTHRHHWLNAVTLGWQLALGDDDVYLNTLPQFHVNGWGLPLATAAMGIVNVIQRAVDGPEILRRIEREDVTLLCGAAAVVASITDAAAQLRAEGRSVPGQGLVRMVSGGSATPSAVIERFESITGWEMVHAYGLTECAPVLTVNRVRREWKTLGPAERAERLTRAGAPLLGVRLRVNADGEILARAAKVFDGYWRRPDLSAEALTEGWSHTGDGGEVTDGYLRITDRKKDVIITGGEKVSSLEVEACIYRHPAVQDVAIIAVPHLRWGETPKAVVVLKPGESVGEGDLIAYCREHLTHYKCPTSIEFVDELPRTATGKVQKYLLRERHTSDPGS
jgi:acyl-CoA synthetase (AMP-forming)/AMP-acid ligase II